MKRSALALGLAAAALVGLAAGSWLAAERRGAASRSAPAPQASANDAPRLAQALDRERAARERLERRVAELAAQVDALAKGTDAPSATPAEEGEASEVEADSNSSGLPTAFDGRWLEGEGLHASDVSRLRELWEDLEYEKLALAETAAAEGWANTARYHEELRAIEQDLRDRLDDADYDRYLYAALRPNRVVVRHVISRTAGADAGLQPGDAIVRYDAVRVFKPQELERLSRQGSAGESVRLEVWRNGSRLQVVVPRGPLGVLLGVQRQRPEG